MRAKEWVTKCMSHMRGLIEISTEIHQQVSVSIGNDLNLLDEVAIKVTKPSYLFIVNKAQDIFLSRESLRQLASAWNDLNSRSRSALDEIYPFIFSEDDLLRLHVILQVFQDGGDLKASQLKEWNEINHRFIDSLQKVNNVMAILRIESNRSLPFWR
ncbi:hypothetical protein [Geothrix fermentans]|uniref:hypothetical protein n=1 Tax=Geothrix fermentans TaxID=44676 RepID=UPI0012FA651B|nr:hypothetical protein [Geothrix fermentans]